MYTIGGTFYKLKSELTGLYDEREAAAIAHEILEYLSGLNRSERLIRKDEPLSEEQIDVYNSALESLLDGMPVQYVTNNAWFLGNRFYVDKNVLIPRPETEELVMWLVQYAHNLNDNGEGLKILDVGTGSGCIPVSLKQKLPSAIVTTCDVSAAALAVARRNAANIGVDIEFVQSDFLDESFWSVWATYDIIVSNPPYIPANEKERLHINVREYEPGTALFVPDEDPLVFYDAIARFSKTHLKPDGAMFFEIDNRQANETKDMFLNHGFKTAELRKDMFGNERMLFVAGF